MHDTDVPYECVPAAVLALLHQIAAPQSTSPSARAARTLLGGDLSATGGGPSCPGGRAAHSAAELRAARGWLLREEDCSGGTPASKVPLRLLHCRLRAAGISTILLRCGHVDSTLTFEIFRIGAPAAQVERHALLVLQPERSHLVTVSWPPSEGSPVEDVARDASQLSVVGDDHPLLRLRAGGDGPTDASVPSFCASVGIGSCNDDGLLHGDECTAALALILFETADPLDTSLLVGDASNNLRDGSRHPLPPHDVASVCTLLWDVPTSMKPKDKLAFSCVNSSNYGATVQQRREIVSRLRAASQLAPMLEMLVPVCDPWVYSAPWSTSRGYFEHLSTFDCVGVELRRRA